MASTVVHPSSAQVQQRDDDGIAHALVFGVMGRAIHCWRQRGVAEGALTGQACTVRRSVL
jgi:hypothetical protein